MSLPPDDDRTVLSPNRATPGPAPAQSAGSNHALPNGSCLGEFEITGLLGEGGFGIVYLAYDNSLERHVALKEYMPSAFAARTTEARVSVRSEQNADSFQAGLRSFVNEARMLAQFDHPSLVKVYRFWEANGTAYMVMPFYTGPTLKQALLALTTPPDEAWLKALLAPLLDALDLIHHQQCFHRDIAPDNILMLEDGRPLLLDFGAARRAIGGMNQAFTVILKQGYAPIEQYAEMPGMRQGAWTDLYALASVVHFAIDGHPPPPAVARMMADPYVPLAERFADRFSAGFLTAIDRALAFKPDDRPQSVAEMRTLLGLDAGVPQRVAAPVSVAAAPIASPAPPSPATQASDARPPAAESAASKPPRRHLALAGIAAAVLVASGAGYVIFSKREAPPVAKPAVSTTAPVAVAPAVTVPKAPAPSAAPFDPVFALDEVLGGASLDRQVTVQVAKSQVTIDKDKLSFAVRSSHAGYVYLQMVGTDRNHFHLLFPNAADKNNRIAKGQTLTLPRKEWSMVAGGPAGTNRFVVIVSDVPRDFGGAGLEAGELFSEFPIARAEELQRSHKGTAPLFAGVPDCTGIAGCSPTYGAAAFTIEEVNP
ncbi:MAG: serine/threonine-protein kinase [Telluria sp.]